MKCGGGSRSVRGESDGRERRVRGRGREGRERCKEEATLGDTMVDCNSTV